MAPLENRPDPLVRAVKHGITGAKVSRLEASIRPQKGGFMDSPQGSSAVEALPPMKNNKQQPTKEIRLGAIKAAVWKNDTEAGVRYNVTFSRLYREGESWKSTESFGRDDLLLLGKVADQAHSWICSQNGIPEENHTRAAATRNGDER